MKKLVLNALLLLAAAIFLTNCASLTGFQDGRTVGKNNGELSVSINLSQSPEFDDWTDQSYILEDNYSTFWPSVELGGRYGVAEKVDVSLRLTTNMNIGLGAKVQVLGDRESMAALSLGAELGTFGPFPGLLNVQVPLYFSVHPQENFAWYLSPRYIYQFASYFGVENGLRYVGGNTGLLFGNRHKFGVDFGYYNFDIKVSNVSLFQVGVGGRFALGGGGEKSSPKRK